MFAIVAACSCANDYQDARYGRGTRLFNVTRQKEKQENRGRRCTSCGATNDSHKSRLAEWKKFQHRKSHH